MSNNQKTVETTTTVVANTQTGESAAKESNLIYRIAKAGEAFEKFSDNNLFNQTIIEEIVYPGGKGTGTVTRHPNVYIDFVSSDGQTPTYGTMYRRCADAHKRSQAAFEEMTRAEFAKGESSQFLPGAVWPGRRTTPEGKSYGLGARGCTILYAATKYLADERHNLECVEQCLKRINGWVRHQPNPSALLLAVAGINTKAVPWEKVGPLFAKYLGTLPCRVIITLGSTGTEFYADGTTVSHEAPKVEKVEVAPKAQEGNGFVPDYDEDPFMPSDNLLESMTPEAQETQPVLPGGDDFTL